MTPAVLEQPARLEADGVDRSTLLLGCGDGSEAARLSGSSLSVTVVDACDDACEAAAELLADRPWVRFEVADPSSWEPRAGERYNRVVIERPRGASILRASRQIALAARASAWLAPGGRLTLL